MRTTSDGITYDTETAQEICLDPSGDGDATLYRTNEGRFFLLPTETFLDGVKLRPNQELED